jgi:hypothetical protein
MQLSSTSPKSEVCLLRTAFGWHACIDENTANNVTVSARLGM